MRYTDISEAIFLDRPNRFIAHILVDGREEIAHVKNTGRCRELLVPGCKIFVQHHDDTKRRTRYSLIAVNKGDLLINMDSQAPNKVVEEWLTEKNPFGKLRLLRPEYTYESSRFDFYLETATKKYFVEVKGVTLENNGAVFFPDAPTERGIKHLQELSRAIADGYHAAILFVVQMSGVRFFAPNEITHPEFATALREAQQSGVEILAYECSVTPDSVMLSRKVPIKI